MIKGIIFDLDGVVVFTDEYHYLAWKAVFDEEGLKFDRKMNKKLRGVSRTESLEIVLRENNVQMNQTKKDEILKKKNDLYVELLHEKLNPSCISEETRDTLKTLKDAGLKLAVGSSSKNARLILNKIDLMHYFDEISDGTMIKKSKPDPEVFLTAASLIHLKPEECLVVEDGEAGIIAAINGGFHPVGIGDEISKSLTFTPIKSLKELLTIYKQF